MSNPVLVAHLVGLWLVVGLMTVPFVCWWYGRMPSPVWKTVNVVWAWPGVFLLLLLQWHLARRGEPGDFTDNRHD